MQQRIYVPQYDQEAAAEASILLQKAGEEIFHLVQSFGNEYSLIAKADAAALKMIGRFTPELIAKGMGLDCMLSINPRGSIGIKAYKKNGEKVVGCSLIDIGNIGPYQSTLAESGAIYGRCSNVFTLIDLLPNLDETFKILRSSSHDLSDSTVSELFRDYLQKGKALRLEPYRVYNP